MWTKAIVNACINPITGLLNVENGFVAEPELEPVVQSVIREALLVAEKCGVTVGSDTELFNHVKETIRSTRTNRSSMLTDVLNGRCTEIQALNGYIVDQGRKVGISTPVNQTLLHLILSLSKRQGLGEGSSGESLSVCKSIAEVRALRKFFGSKRIGFVCPHSLTHAHAHSRADLINWF